MSGSDVVIHILHVFVYIGVHHQVGELVAHVDVADFFGLLEMLRRSRHARFVAARRTAPAAVVELTVASLASTTGNVRNDGGQERRCNNNSVKILTWRP